MEYVAACLIEPFQAGDDYELTFQIASVPMGFAGEPCNNGVITILRWNSVCLKSFLREHGCPDSWLPNCARSLLGPTGVGDV